jgi:hypothetical protein
MAGGLDGESDSELRKGDAVMPSRLTSSSAGGALLTTTAHAAFKLQQAGPGVVFVQVEIRFIKQWGAESARH